VKLDFFKQSVVSEHTKNLGHSFDWEKVKILDTEHFYKRLISEMIHIKEQKNGIHCNKGTELLDGSYSIILQELTMTRF